MGKLEVVHTTDWHLGFLHGKHPDPLGVLLPEIKKPLDYAIKHSIPHVIVSGDLTNTHIMLPDVLQAMIRLLTQYDGRLNIHIIPGNHCYHSDSVYSMLALKEAECLWETINFYTQVEQVELDGILVNFIPYPYSEPLPSDRPALNVTHLTPAGAKMDNGFPAKKGVVLPYETGDYTLNGHLHLEQEGDNYYCCGTLYPVRFGEKGSKGFTHLTITENVEGGYIEAARRRVNVKPRIRFEEVNIHHESDFSTLENNPDVFYSLRIDPGVQVPHALLRGFSNILKTTPIRNITEMADQQVIQSGLVTLELDDTELLQSFLTQRQQPAHVQQRAMELDSQMRSQALAKINTAKSLAQREEIEEAA